LLAVIVDFRRFDFCAKCPMYFQDSRWLRFG
jgi:hypothetical protein